MGLDTVDVAPRKQFTMAQPEPRRVSPLMPRFVDVAGSNDAAPTPQSPLIVLPPILGAKSKYASTNSVSGAHGSTTNAHLDTTICCQQYSCSESRWLQFSPSIHVLCYEPSSECLHVTLSHGLQLDEQQVLPWTGSISHFFCTPTFRAVSLRLLLDFIPRVNDLGQLITIPLLACLVNLIGIIALQRKRLGAHVSQSWPTSYLALRRTAMPDSDLAATGCMQGERRGLLRLIQHEAVYVITRHGRAQAVRLGRHPNRSAHSPARNARTRDQPFKRPQARTIIRGPLSAPERARISRHKRQDISRRTSDLRSRRSVRCRAIYLSPESLPIGHEDANQPLGIHC